MQQQKTMASIEFDRLVMEAKACTKCFRMRGSEKVIGYSSGNLCAAIVFVGEAPGRLGADSSLIPFHGDQAGHNFESLLEQVGISRYDVFVTNAVLCNPKDAEGNNSTPTREEISNCSPFLKRQIDLVDSPVVATLGATALEAVSRIELHQLSLAGSVRSVNSWYRRKLIPLYHPGQRAMSRRSFPNQLSDYQFLAEVSRRGGTKRRMPSGSATASTMAVVDCITKLKPVLSYFALHKLFFLAELESKKRLGRRITSSYIVRQKDGPYCVELHPARLRKACPQLSTQMETGRLTLRRTSTDLFAGEPDAHLLSPDQERIVCNIVARYGQLSDMELKRRVYMSTEMRKVLRAEKKEKKNLFNVPLLDKA